MPVLLEVAERALRRIDRQLDEVGAPEPLQLRIQVGEIAPLQQGVVAEVDAGDDVLRAESHLFRLGEEVLDVAIEHQPPHSAHWHELLGDELGRIERVERQQRGRLRVEQLQPELPFGEVAGLDSVPQIAAVKIRVRAVDLHRFVPEHGLQAELRLPVELHERRNAGFVDESERVHAEALP